MLKIRKISAFLALAVLLPLGAAKAEITRTFDLLTDAELDQLSKMTLNYYTCVTGRLENMDGPDRSKPERIFATAPPYIMIARQQCRISLINVEKLLYSYGLNPEFITNHVNTLRDDVVHFALQQTLRASREGKEEKQREDEWNKDTDSGEKNDPKPRRGLGILTSPPKSSPGRPSPAGSPPALPAPEAGRQ